MGLKDQGFLNMGYRGRYINRICIEVKKEKRVKQIY